MSELANLMAVFGAVDEAVNDNRNLLPAVVALAPVYDEGAAGWFDGIKTWARQAADERRLDRGEEDVEQLLLGNLVPLDEALSDLATEDSSDELASRRLIAIALLTRVRAASTMSHAGLSAMAVPDEALAGALGPIAAGVPYSGPLSLETRTVRLLDILADTRTYPTLDSMVQAAVSNGLMSQAVARQVMVPLSWTVVPSTEAGGPAVAFETRMKVDASPIADVEGILDPANWTRFNPPWCAMTDGTATAGYGPTGPHQFLEVISLDCAAVPPPLLSLKTVLDFKRADLTDGSGRVLEYRLAGNQTAGGGDGLVTVDEGSLVVRQVGSTVEVITTKRVQFRAFRSMSPYTASGLAWFVWIFGYSSLAEFFISQVAGIDPSKIHEVGSRRSPAGWTGNSPPPGVGQAAQAGHLTHCSSQFDIAAAAIEDAFNECSHDMRSSLTRLAEGQYRPAMYLTDAAKLSSHLARHGTIMLKFWANVVPRRGHGAGPH